MSVGSDRRKTAKPERDGPFGECDVCGERRQLSRCWPMGVETHACDECRDDTGGD